MAADDINKEQAVEQRDHLSINGSSDVEEKAGPAAYPQSDADIRVTFKTWVVVSVLASAYGVSSLTDL